jgi:hypothetical protein
MCTSTAHAIKAAKRDDLRRTAESLALPLLILHQALQPPINYFHDSILPFHVFIWTLIASA